MACIDPQLPQPTKPSVDPLAQAELDHLEARLAAFLSAQRWAKVAMVLSGIVTVCGLVEPYLVPGSHWAVKVGLVGLIASKAYAAASQHAMKS